MPSLRRSGSPLLPFLRRSLIPSGLGLGRQLFPCIRGGEGLGVGRGEGGQFYAFCSASQVRTPATIVLLTLVVAVLFLAASQEKKCEGNVLISVRARSCRGLIAPHPPLPAGPARHGGGVLPRAFFPPGISSYA